MNTVEVIRLARTLGVVFRVTDGDGLRAGPADRMTPELRQGIRENKAELVAYVRAANFTSQGRTAHD